ncbi:MAG: GatB/YqeY domain-containing protein [Myxococcota bacterium]
MSLVDLVSEQMKQAMKARDKARTSALRGIRAAFLDAMKASGSDGTVSDDEAITMLRRLAKQRKESIEAYVSGGRDDLVDAERAELAVIEEFLPKLADEATTREWVAAAIAQTGATEPGHMGKVMGVLMKAHKADLDGKLANRVVRELLT